MRGAAVLFATLYVLHAVVAELNPEYEERGRKALTPFPTSLAWSSDGSTLYAGYTDNVLRVWAVASV